MGRPGRQTAYSEETHSLRPKAAAANFLKKPLYRSPSHGLPADTHLPGRPLALGRSHIQGAQAAPFSRSRDRSSRKPRAGPFRLPLHRHFPLFKGEKNSPKAVFEEPSEVYFVISSRSEARRVTRGCLTGTRGPGLFARNLAMQPLPRMGAVRAPRMAGLERQPVVFFLRGWPTPLPWHKRGPPPPGSEFQCRWSPSGPRT